MIANELMQGDLVLYEYNGDKFPARVVEIYRSSALVESVSKEYEPIEIAEDKLFPVAISPEILFKNGWIYLGDYWDIEIDEGFMLEIGVDGKNCYWWIVGTMLICPINYVHELQHALRLRGIDKEIVL